MEMKKSKLMQYALVSTQMESFLQTAENSPNAYFTPSIWELKIGEQPELRSIHHTFLRN